MLGCSNGGGSLAVAMTRFRCLGMFLRPDWLDSGLFRHQSSRPVYRSTPWGRSEKDDDRILHASEDRAEAVADGVPPP